jgi:hypothetical protein
VLVLVELFVAAAVLDAIGLLDVLRVNWAREDLQYHFFSQQRHIAVPWLLGIGVGEVIARCRKPGGSERREI